MWSIYPDGAVDTAGVGHGANDGGAMGTTGPGSGRVWGERSAWVRGGDG